MGMFDMLKEIAAKFPETTEFHEHADDDPVSLPDACDVCGELWRGPGRVCEQCQTDQGRGYSVLVMAGRCRNGEGRDGGTRWHAVKTGQYSAICGAKPGRHSVGWSSWKVRGQAVTCPRCLRKLKPQ